MVLPSAYGGGTDPKFGDYNMKKQPNKLGSRGQAGGFLAGSIPLVGFCLFALIPLALSLVVAFSELHSPELFKMQFVGFQNFINVLTNGDQATYASYWTTLLYALNAPICIAISLWIAYLINKSKFGKTFFRSVFFIPYVCSSVVISLTFKNMLYRTDGGILNELLDMLGFKPVEWLSSSPWLFMLCAVIMTVWAGLGWCIVLFQAALANVDSSYYEAARLDGASDGQMFWKITWKAISPTTAYLLTMKLIWAFQSMAEMHLLHSQLVPAWNFGEGSWVSDTVVKHIYNMMFDKLYSQGYGMAAAAGWVLAIIILVITRINMRLQKRWVSYDF